LEEERGRLKDLLDVALSVVASIAEAEIKKRFGHTP
jgi:hypothetical protein